jgi:hypothetical protein
MAIDRAVSSAVVEGDAVTAASARATMASP